MKALAVTIWVFINLIFFGMIGYMYLLWSQYWLSDEKEVELNTFSYDQQIYFYNRGYNVNTSTTIGIDEKKRVKHALKENVTITLIKNARPRFPHLQPKDFEMDTEKYRCKKSDSANDCDRKTLEYKEKILNELKRVFMDESNVLKWGLDSPNPYNVHYVGIKGNHLNKPPSRVRCELKRVKLKTIKRTDKPFNSKDLRYLIPRRTLFENKHFNSCAVVASSGALSGSNLGKLIDSHELVLRFNHAPTVGYETDVGTKTNVRILNSQVVSKKEFKFLEANIYKNITLLLWDPCNYTSTLEEWFYHPDHDVFSNYFEFRRRNPKSRCYLMDPRSLWDLWNFLQGNSPSRLRKNPPSSGFLGLVLELLLICIWFFT